MENKYTLKEFEKKYNNAVDLAIEKLMKELEEHDTENKMGSMEKILFSMQNINAFQELRKILFEEK